MKVIKIVLGVIAACIAALCVATLAWGVDTSGPMLLLLAFSAGALFAKDQMEKENLSIVQS